jgi:hypothetical protein
MSNVLKFKGRTPPPPPPPPTEGGALSPGDRLQALIAASINEQCAAYCTVQSIRSVFEQNARLFKYFAEVRYGTQR